jgi:hypothetical protein
MKSRPGQKEVGEQATTAFARAAIAVVLVVAVACTDSTGPARRIAITPTAPTVALQATPQGQALITSVTLTNTSSHPVAWSSCGMSLERAPLPALPPGTGSSETVWESICFLLDNSPAPDATISTSFGASLGGPILKPGESVDVPVSIPVGQPPYSTYNFKGDPGAYRFHFALSTEILGTYYPVPHDLSVSDFFTLLPAS